MHWNVSKSVAVVSQFLSGDTLMQSSPGADVVNNDYTNGFVSLTYKWQDFPWGEKLWNKKHKSTIRVEAFSVTDNDNTLGDNNNEDGHGFTINHSYRLSRHWFLAAEFNYINSQRSARYYEHNAIDLIEKQIQLSARYFY